MEDFIVDLSAQEETIRQVIEPLLDSEGFELVRIKLKRAQTKSLLCLFVDTSNQENGIVIKNLEDISRLLSDVLDASFEDGSVLVSRYDLEVSSPGLDRPLSKRSHFQSAVGKQVRVRLKNALASGAKNICGELLETTDDGIVVQVDGNYERINFVDISEANIVFDFSTLEKNKKRSTKK